MIYPELRDVSIEKIMEILRESHLVGMSSGSPDTVPDDALAYGLEQKVIDCYSIDPDGSRIQIVWIPEVKLPKTYTNGSNACRIVLEVVLTYLQKKHPELKHMSKPEKTVKRNTVTRARKKTK